MHQFEINGGARLTGTLKVDGSKNAALPLMAASILADDTLTLRNVPDLSDIRKMHLLLDEVIELFLQRRPLIGRQLC